MNGFRSFSRTQPRLLTIKSCAGIHQALFWGAQDVACHVIVMTMHHFGMVTHQSLSWDMVYDLLYVIIDAPALTETPKEGYICVAQNPLCLVYTYLAPEINNETLNRNCS